MKKLFIWVISIMLLLSLIGCKKQSSKTVVVNGTEYTVEDLARIEQANKKLGHILNVKLSDITLENGYFIGTVQNTNTDIGVKSSTIDIAIYDSGKNKLGDEYVYIGRLNCGETYKINQKFYDNKYKNFDSFKMVNNDIIFD